MCGIVPSVTAFALLLAAGGGSSVDEAQAWPPPPFEAWVRVDGARVRVRPETTAPEVGLLTLGDRVRVVACTPRCNAPGAWALLDGPGAVRLSLLALPPPPAGAAGQGATAVYVYGRLIRGGQVHGRPDPRAPVVARHRVGNDLAFVDEAAPSAPGWLLRPGGGYLPRRDVRLHAASPFAGVHDPPPALAFVVRASTLRRDDGTAAVAARHQWFAAPELLRTGRVSVDGGTLPRRDVRIARQRPRPAGVPPGARWVHVDLDEQVLTAYEGEALVFATLVSTGRRDHATRTGLFPVFYKSIHGDMHGDDPGDPYFVDEVPWILFFREGMALHGTFWHDAFGRRSSHGCVNLSFHDAQWLFEFAPPALPRGWHAIEPIEAGLATLWVKVEHARGRAEGVRARAK